VNYTYDDIGQLTSALAYSSGGVPISNEQKGYGYDAASNLNVRTNDNSGATTTFTVDLKNQLTGGPTAAYGYDDDGNLTSSSNGYVTYSYTDEDQLATVSYLDRYRTDFVYDGLGRLRKRIEYAWDPTYGWLASGETRYVYDGNVVIQERDSRNAPTVSYTRGSDLSGSFEGAGGIGGLLARSHGYSGGSWAEHNFYHADGNGNVTMLIDNNTPPNVTAAYGYDSFGNTISLNGSLAGANVYRFSSKEIHV